MNLFKKFSSNSKDKVSNARIITKKSLFDCGVDIDKSSYFELFSAALGRVMVNQNNCSEKVVRGRNWNVDFTNGLILFGEDSYDAQLIGTESTVSNSWLWGWANPSGINESVLKYSRELQLFGEANSFNAFFSKDFELNDTFNGHNLSIIASALHDDNVCYYRCPYEGGAAFVLFRNVEDVVFEQVDMPSFSRYVLECIQQYRVDHMIFIKSFLYQNECAYRTDNNSIFGDFAKGQRLEFLFEDIDGMKRLEKIRSC